MSNDEEVKKRVEERLRKLEMFFSEDKKERDFVKKIFELEETIVELIHELEDTVAEGAVYRESKREYHEA